MDTHVPGYNSLIDKGEMEQLLIQVHRGRTDDPLLLRMGEQEAPVFQSLP